MFFDRSASGVSVSTVRRNVRTITYNAPRVGLIENDNIAVPNPEGAKVLDNFYPSGKGARLRKGSGLHATIDEDGTDTVTHLASYEYGATAELYACTASYISEVTAPGSATTEPTPVITGQSNGDYSSLQFTTAAGHFLLMVNGEDAMLGYTGSYWVNVSDAAVSKIDYDAETGAFTAGETLTGGTSGATATIQRVYDNGTTGTLLLTGITGTFQDNETITDGSTGSATSDGTVSTVWAAVTGIDTSTISAIWSHKSRVWFIEGNSLSAWYLPVDSIAGAATEFSLSGKFSKGGKLLFGATWSVDSGSGMDDMCVFVTDQGQAAIYQGTDPSDATKWAIVGTYDLGRPINKRSFFKSGGNLHIITDDSIANLADAISRESTTLQARAWTYPIEDRWRRYVALYDGSPQAFEAIIWPQKAMLLVTMPQLEGEASFCLISNSRTGAWARYTNWDARCFALLGDRLFFGTTTGTVFEAEITGADNGASYTGVWVPRFNDFGSASWKTATSARLQAIANRSFTPELYALADFSEDLPTPGTSNMNESTSVWGTAVWGEFTWSIGQDTFEVNSSWQTVAASGTYVAPVVYIVSGITSQPDVEIATLWLQYEEGNPQ